MWWWGVQVKQTLDLASNRKHIHVHAVHSKHGTNVGFWKQTLIQGLMSPRQNNRKRTCRSKSFVKRPAGDRPALPELLAGDWFASATWRNSTWPEAWSYHRRHTGGLCTFWLQPCISTRHRSCLARPVEEKRGEERKGGGDVVNTHKLVTSSVWSTRQYPHCYSMPI